MPPATAEKPALTTADRVAALADKTLQTEATRRLYRLSVVSSPERPAPFYDHTVDVGNGCGATFADATASHGEDSRGKPRVVEHKGNRQWLTDSELATLKANVKTWIVRWVSREGGRARLLNASMDKTVVLNPVTDEALAPYLLIEGPIAE